MTNYYHIVHRQAEGRDTNLLPPPKLLYDEPLLPLLLAVFLVSISVMARFTSALLTNAARLNSVTDPVDRALFRANTVSGVITRGYSNCILFIRNKNSASLRGLYGSML